MKFLGRLFTHHKFMRRVILAFVMYLIWIIVKSVFVDNIDKWGEINPTNIAVAILAFLSSIIAYYFYQRKDNDCT